MSENKNVKKFPGWPIPDSWGSVALLLVAIIAGLLLTFPAQQVSPQAKTATDVAILAEADLLVVIQPGTTTEYEIPVSEQVKVGLDGRKAGVTEYLFKSHSDGGGLAVTGFTYLGSVQEAGKHIPGDREIIVAKSPIGDSTIVLKFVGSTNSV